MIDKRKVYRDTEFSSKAVSVYLYLCERASKETKSCYPSMKTIAKDLHLSLASVKRSIQELERSAYIKKENRFRDNGGKSSNLYFIEWIWKRTKKSPSKNDEKTPRGRSVFCVSYGMAQCEPRMWTVHFNSYIVYRKRKKYSQLYKFKDQESPQEKAVSWKNQECWCQALGRVHEWHEASRSHKSNAWYFRWWILVHRFSCITDTASYSFRPAIPEGVCLLLRLISNHSPPVFYMIIWSEKIKIVPLAVLFYPFAVW